MLVRPESTRRAEMNNTTVNPFEYVNVTRLQCRPRPRRFYLNEYTNRGVDTTDLTYLRPTRKKEVSPENRRSQRETCTDL